MIRVLIAEDSATCLGLLVEIIGSDPELKVIATASHGVEAVRMTRELRPDVVVMDVHMPIMDGFEATRQIMNEVPTPIVIVSASVDVRQVTVSMHALRLGALALLPKPALTDDEDVESMSRQFTSAIRSMAQVRVVRRWHAVSATPLAPASLPALPHKPVSLVAIATSTGGPGALYRVLSDLPASLPVPIVIVQHISVGFVEGMAAWLDGASPLKVKVAQDGERLSPGCAYIAPDELHLGLASRNILRVDRSAAIGGFRPSATYLFESVARHHGSGALAVMMTGMGEDGVAGLRVLRDLGGRVLAQDEQTSVVFGMPGAAIAAGVVDSVLPLDMIAMRLRRLTSEAQESTWSKS